MMQEHVRRHLGRAIMSMTLAAAALAAGGCLETTARPPSPQGDAVALRCPHPVQGQRYSMCGRLSSAGVSADGSGTMVIGSVDSAQPAPADRDQDGYQMAGGSFHGAR